MTHIQCVSEDLQLAYGLTEATEAAVLREHARWLRSWKVEKIDRPRQVAKTGLTYDQALSYLGMIHHRVNSSGLLQSVAVWPFVAGWHDEQEQPEGFVVEVWAVPSETPGLWDIVDRSLPMFKLPWIFGLGWCKGEEFGK